MLKNKKGFSLIELLITVAILSILSVIFVPQFQNSSEDSREKLDQAAINNLQIIIQNTFEDNKEYKLGKEIAADAKDNQILINYEPQNEVLTLRDCEMISKDGVVVKSGEGSDLGQNLAKFIEMIGNSVNSQMDPITLKSNFYKEYLYQFKITFPDVDLKVDVEYQKFLPED